MKTLEMTMSQLTGPSVLADLVDLLRTNDPEFVRSEAACQKAVSALREALAAQTDPGMDAYLAAHDADIISRITYAGYLGYRVNLENFHHPIGIDFVHLDTIDYRKEHLFDQFPANRAAYAVIERFRKNLPDRLQALYDDIEHYYIHLECSGPKLAHYAGYVIANNLLPWVEPGYHADRSQTGAFTREIKAMFGFLPL